MIEKGRHLNIAKQERFCPICPNVVEDETHFLIMCKAFQKEREKLFSEAKSVDENFPQKCCLDKMKFLLTNKNVIKSPSHYINICTQLRGEFMQDIT